MTIDATTTPTEAEVEVDPATGPAPFEMTWSSDTTPLEAIERALYALADQVSGTTTRSGAEWTVLVHPRSSVARRDRLEHQLRQEVTDQTLRVRIAERTDPIRNLVFALAFSRSGLAGAASNENDNEAEGS